MDKTETQRIWVVWADNHPDHASQCLRDGLIIIGWDEAGDLAAIGNAEGVRVAVQRLSAKGNAVTPLRRFRLEMAEGDLVAMLSHTREGSVSVGKVAGPYRYQEVAGGFKHTRAVDWLKVDAPRGRVGREGKVYRHTIAQAYDIDRERIAGLLPA